MSQGLLGGLVLTQKLLLLLQKRYVYGNTPLAKPNAEVGVSDSPFLRGIHSPGATQVR